MNEKPKKYKKGIKNWPKEDRPGEKLFKEGEHKLSNTELLAILLRSGTKGQSVLGKRVFPHLLRHSDAIIRLRKTGNPKALQYHLGHNTPAITLRYLSTLTYEDALRVEQEVEF